jgi:outer membrane receptor for ferrienterochelin and colicins
MWAACAATPLALGPSALIASASIAARGQCSTATIDVSVSDGERPLASARVLAMGGEWTTDTSGQVAIEIVPGQIRVEVTAEGHVPTTVDIDAAPCARVKAAILLEPLVFEEEVVVTATRTNRRLQDQPMRVEVIDREEIEEKALMTPGSVAMLLGETTGLRVQTTAPSLGAANVRIQGLRGRYSQVLSDGLPLFGAQGDSFTLLQVPPLDLGQVEVIKGAASALYGTAALGGVINLVSRRPAVRERLALANATTLGGTDLSLWLAEPARSRWGWTVLGGLHGQRRVDLDEDGWTDVAGFTRGLVRPRVFWDNRSGRSLFVTGSVMTERRDGGTIESGKAPDGEPFVEALDTTRGDVGTVVRTLVGASRVLSVRGSFSTQQQDRLFGGVRERGVRRTWFGEATLQGTSGRHTWVVGGAWQQDAYRPRDLPAFAYTFDAPAVFVQDEIAFSPHVSLSASARADAHSEYGVIVAPRVSILVRPGRAWTVRATGGTGAFAPTPFTDETDETGLARVQPPSGLRAERATSASIDVSRAIRRVEIVGTLFASRVAHPLQQRVVAPDLVELVNARTPTRTIGTELLARYRAPGFLAMLTHAWTRSHEEDPDLDVTRDVPLTPANTVTFNVMWEGDDWGRFGVEAYYYGRQPLDDNPYRAVGSRYLLVGALGERRVGRVRVFVNAENLGNVRQTRWDPLVRPERRPDGRWTVDAWAPLDGLVVNGGVRVAF